MIPATPTVAMNPVNIPYGTPLANSQLSGRAQWTVGGSLVNVPGTLAYTSAAGTVLNAGDAQGESVTFTPADGADYTTVTTAVTVNVVHVTSTVLSVNPVNITYGAALQNSQLSGTAQGTVNGQTVSIPGTFAYTSAWGTVLKAGNVQSEAVTFTPADSTDFTTASGTVTVNVAQATPTATLNPVNITCGTALANSQLGGTVQWTVGGSTATVPGTWAYTSAAGTVLNVTSGQSGSVILQSEAVTFTPTDTVDYTKATSTVTVTVTPAAGSLPANQGVFNAGYWYRDMNGVLNPSGDDTPLAFGPSSGATPVVGDWDGSGKTEIGYYLNGNWYLKLSTGTVEQFTFGFTGSNVIPVVGDWNGDGRTEVGVYCNGAWFRDVDGSHTWDPANQAAVAYLGWSGASVVPVPGHWAGNGETQMGVYCNGVWFLDSKGTGQYDGSYSYWGWNAPLIPVAGNWDGGGTKSQFGVYSQGVWFRDADGTHQWDAANQAAVAYYGWAGAQPVVGNWLTYTVAARPASLPAAAAASLSPQAVADASCLGAAVQSPFAAAASPGSGAAQEQGNPLALVASTSDSGAAGASTGGDNAVAADHDHDYDHDHEYIVPDMVPDMLPAQPTGLVAIDPQAVDRIDLTAAVKTALGPRVRLSI